MIYGSNDRKTFIKLKKLNKNSKSDNVSMLLIKKESFDVYKINHLSKIKQPPHSGNDVISYYGVNSPNISDFLESKKTPPFFYENWIVAFSGEIFNIQTILGVFETCDFLVPDNNSCLINCMLNFMQQNIKNEINILKEVFSLLEGSYSCWIFNIKTKNCFLLKCNSDLYANIYNNDFSTKDINGFESLNDGEIYQLTREGITPVGYFDCAIY